MKERREGTAGHRKTGCFAAVLIASIIVNILVLNIFILGRAGGLRSVATEKIWEQVRRFWLE